MDNKDTRKVTGKDNFEIIMPIKDNKVLVRCKHCGTTMTMSKASYYGNPKCKNRDCINTKYKLKSIGKKVGDFVCVEEHGGKIILECQLCHNRIERERRVLENVSSLICSNPECENRVRKVNPLTDTIYGHFKCVKDLPRNKVKVQCLCCNTINEIGKEKFKRAEEDTEKRLCKNIACKYFDTFTSEDEINRQIEENDKCLSHIGINKIRILKVTENTVYILDTDNGIHTIGIKTLKNILKTQNTGILR